MVVERSNILDGVRPGVDTAIGRHFTKRANAQYKGGYVRALVEQPLESRTCVGPVDGWCRLLMHSMSMSGPPPKAVSDLVKPSSNPHNDFPPTTPHHAVSLRGAGGRSRAELGREVGGDFHCRVDPPEVSLLTNVWVE